MNRTARASGGRRASPWLITYSDLATLLLAFFVLLMSRSVIDERNKRKALESVSSQFGVGIAASNLAEMDAESMPLEPGPMDSMTEDDLEPLRDMIFDDASKDLQFQENRYVQIFSINNEVLFKPGEVALSDTGRLLLSRLLPYLQRIGYPLLVAGHASSRRDEERARYTVNLDGKALDSTWLLSWRRAMVVYRFLTANGIPVNRLSLEAFGQFHPRFSNSDAEGRRKNRRVDLVLDKRNREWMDKVTKLRETNPSIPHEHFFKGFKFDLDMPGAPAGQP
jgi:chemotaxis protein MotB